VHGQGDRKDRERDETGRKKRKKKKNDTTGPRVVPLNGGEELEGHVPNSVRTAKYNVVTFLPIFLWEMFSRVAYLYFLVQVRALLAIPKCPHWNLKWSM
jgi:hypothetical protein